MPPPARATESADHDIRYNPEMDEFEQLSAIIADGSRTPAERIHTRLERGLILFYTARWT